MDTVKVVLPIMKRSEILLKDAIASWTGSMEHTSLFNKLQGVTIGGENMYDHIVKNYVYPSYWVAVKNNFREKIVKIYNEIHQGYDYCDCASCHREWKSRRGVREKFLRYTFGGASFIYFGMALRLYLENGPDLRSCYYLITQSIHKEFVGAYNFQLREFMSQEDNGSFCKGDIKKSRCWTCDKTGKEIKIKCCCNSNTAGNGYCKVHSK